MSELEVKMLGRRGVGESIVVCVLDDIVVNEACFCDV